MAEFSFEQIISSQPNEIKMHSPKERRNVFNPLKRSMGRRKREHANTLLSFKQQRFH